MTKELEVLTFALANCVSAACSVAADSDWIALVTDDADDNATPVVVAIFVTTGMLVANIMLGVAFKAFEEPTLDDIFDGAEGLMPRDDVGNGAIA
jgi:hypothetical protein